MIVIVGLGNPDKKYLDTFHNVGFRCLDGLAERLGVAFDKGECRAVTAHTRVNGQKVILVKPLTYMNLSGESVLELANKYKIELGNLVVVYDDVDIPLGSVRIRQNGSAGTHNGMKNIVKLLKTEEILRIRVGIGKVTQMDLADYVLSKISDDDKIVLNSATKTAVDALFDFINGEKIEIVMQKYNKVL